MNNPSAKNKAVLVLGMHRSGTSAVMRLINLLGADIGNDLLPPAADNPSGFWEHRGIVRIHDELLGALGRSWHDIRSLPVDWLDSEATASARKKLVDLLSREFSASPLWAVKDPRLCRLLPLWHQVLSELNVEPSAIFVVRHPDEVAQSILVRDQIPVGYTRLSWLEHTVEAEIASRDTLRVAVSYDDVLMDWRKETAKIRAELALHWPSLTDDASTKVDQFLNSGSRHHTKGAADEASPNLVRLVYDAFLAKTRNSNSDWSAVQRVSDLYRASADVFLEGLEESVHQVMEKSVEITTLNGRLENVCSAFKEISAQTYLHGMPTEVVAESDVAKIYYRKVDETYSEDRSVQIQHRGLRSPTAFKFELPSGTNADFVRFDPSELPGEFAIRDIEINGNLVGFLDGLFSPHCTHVVALTNDELRIASIDNDPHFELDCRSFDVSPRSSMIFQLSCSRITPYAELTKIVDAGLLNLEQNRALGVRTVSRNLATGLDSLSQRQEIAITQLQSEFEKIVEKGLLNLEKQRVSRETAATQEWIEHADAIIEHHEIAISRLRTELVGTFEAELLKLEKSRQKSAEIAASKWQAEFAKVFQTGLEKLAKDQEHHEKAISSNVAMNSNLVLQHQELLASNWSTNIDNFKTQVHADGSALSKRVDWLCALGEQSSARVAQQISELAEINLRMEALLHLQSRSLMQRIRDKFKKTRSLESVQ